MNELQQQLAALLSILDAAERHGVDVKVRFMERRREKEIG